MALPPTFIMSLDCEGKWGMADHLKPYHHELLTTERLTGAYRQLAQMLGRFEIAATFAFVMAFVLGRDERRDYEVLERRDPADAWLSHYWRELDAGHGDGWHNPDALALARDECRHEIACHGFCHRPLADDAASPAEAEAELALAARVAAAKGVALETLVFPRNAVGNLAAVSAAGFVGFRTRLRRRGGVLGRMQALAEEFVTWAPPQRPLLSAREMVAIPPGRFFNWRFGARRVVPPSVTRARWRGQLDRCAREGGVVHLWLHPHNLITGPGTAAVLETVLGDVARLRDRGRIEVMTQRDYCRRLQAA